MNQQIMQYNRMINNEQYKQAERYHNGIKYAEYGRLLKRVQRVFANFNPRSASFKVAVEPSPTCSDVA